LNVALVHTEEAVERIAHGGMVVVVDDEWRENEGDLTLAAECVTADAVAFMIRHARGLVCMPCDGHILDALRIGPMVDDNTCTNQTAFCVSVDHRSVGSGISAPDRAETIRRMLDPRSRPEDFSRPGHVFPLRAREGGVLRRTGHTEAAVDLARLAGLRPAAVICEILKDDGTPARVPDLEAFVREHDLVMVSIDHIVEYRLGRASSLLLARSALSA
jgi:3,4-dihydroxy 2-butanone 4-phosphate synthase/GTP cyclohydrolase II